VSAGAEDPCEFRAPSLALYNEERANGTSFADIFDELIALGDAQPADFRAMMDWEGQRRRPAEQDVRGSRSPELADPDEHAVQVGDEAHPRRSA
jgi:hypothetical protein